MITERDVHKDFFNAPPASSTRRSLPTLHTTTTQLHDTEKCSDDLTSSSEQAVSRLTRFKYALCDHSRFALSLLVNYIPRSNSTISEGFNEWQKRIPGLFVIKSVCRGKCRPSPIEHTENEEDELKFTPEIIRKSLIADTLIGFSIGSMSIPQGMSYALMAGLPYQYGLYNNLIHPLAYFLFGTSRHAITGVGAVENLMVGESLNSLVGGTASMQDRINAGILLSLLSAACFFLFRVTGLAIIADLLADPILSGFATAAAFLVGTSQLKHAFGLNGLKAEWSAPKAITYILTHLDLITFPALLLCITSLSFLLACKRLSRKLPGRWFVPGPLLLVVFGCLTSFCWDFPNNHMIRVVGSIPSGVPSFGVIPSLTFVGDENDPSKPLLRLVFVEALKLSGLFFVIHVSVAKTIALRQKYQIEVADEVTALGATNLLGSLFGCYPTCTSISRSSVAEGLGAFSGIQGPASSIIVLVTLVALTGVLQYLPMPCLAAVVLVGVSSTFEEFTEFKRLWKLQKAAHQAAPSGRGGSSPDLLLWGVAFVSTFCLGATEGILISVGLSLLWIGKSILRPPFIELGRIPGTIIYRDRIRFNSIVELHPNIAIFRIDAPLNFCNSGFLEREVRRVIETRFHRSMPSSSIPTTGLPLTSNSMMSSSSTSSVSADNGMSEIPMASSSFGPPYELQKRLEDPFMVRNKAMILHSPKSEHQNAYSPCMQHKYIELVSPPLQLPAESRHAYPRHQAGRANEPNSDASKGDVRGRPPTPAMNDAPNIFILDCSSINGLDITAISAIERIVKNASTCGVIVAFSNWKGPQRDFLWRANFYKVVPPQRCFLSTHDAFLWAEAIRNNPGVGTEIIRTLSPQRPSTALSQPVPPAIHEIYEWDGLSALVPNVRVVQETTTEGSRNWEVSAAYQLS